MKKLIDWFMTKVLRRKKTKVYNANHYFTGNTEVWEIERDNYKEKYL